MNARDKVLERAPRWNEKQAEAALHAAEGDESARDRARLRGRSDLIERAAALRARQPEPSDAVALVREGREELEQRGL